MCATFSCSSATLSTRVATRARRAQCAAPWCSVCLVCCEKGQNSRASCFFVIVSCLHADLTSNVERHMAALYGAAMCLSVMSFPFDRSQIETVVGCMELFSPKHLHSQRVSQFCFLRDCFVFQLQTPQTSIMLRATANVVRQRDGASASVVATCWRRALPYLLPPLIDRSHTFADALGRVLQFFLDLHTITFLSLYCCKYSCWLRRVL